MNTAKKIVLCLSLFCFYTISEYQTVFAQSIWLDRSHEKTIVLEIQKPDFDGEDQTTFMTTSWFLYGRFPLSTNVNMVAEIPFSHYKLDAETYYFMENEGQSAFGNPYVGFEFYNEKKTVFGEIGLRLPMTPKEDASLAQSSGAVTEFVERTEAFARDVLPVSVLINYMKTEDSGLMFRLRGGPIVWLATGNRNDTEWFVVYSIQGGYHSEKFNILAGLSGRWFVSAEDAAFSEATFHQFGIAATVDLGTFQPGLMLKLPLDEDLSDTIDLTFGLTLGFILN
jgi:hypothetical protein